MINSLYNKFFALYSHFCTLNVHFCTLIVVKTIIVKDIYTQKHTHDLYLILDNDSTKRHDFGMERDNVCYAPASIPIAITKKEKNFFQINVFLVDIYFSMCYNFVVD